MDQIPKYNAGVRSNKTTTKREDGIVCIYMSRRQCECPVNGKIRKTKKGCTANGASANPFLGRTEQVFASICSPLLNVLRNACNNAWVPGFLPFVYGIIITPYIRNSWHADAKFTKIFSS